VVFIFFFSFSLTSLREKQIMSIEIPYSIFPTYLSIIDLPIYIAHFRGSKVPKKFLFFKKSANLFYRPYFCSKNALLMKNIFRKSRKAITKILVLHIGNSGRDFRDDDRSIVLCNNQLNDVEPAFHQECPSGVGWAFTLKGCCST